MVPDLTESPLTSNAYFRSILDGVLEVAAMSGWSMTIFAQRMWDNFGHTVRRSYDGRCDGLIMVSPEPGNEVVQTLHDRGTPLVLVGSTPWMGHLSCVDVDNVSIGVSAARYLVQLGHKTLAYVGNDREQVSSIERRVSFTEEAIRLGIPENRINWIAVPRHTRSGCEGEVLVNKIHESPTIPTGILCWHDGLAKPLVNSLIAAGFGVPRDFSVIGVDDSPEALHSSPSITSFTNPIFEQGKRAAKMIIERLIEGSHTEQVVRFSSNLVVRESTGAAPSDSSDSVSGA
jgi:LacI family transcriptional regulator